jgi:glycosyltransferase involved in cell wall biosynthesis
LRPCAIHQFHSGVAYGTGITNGMFFIQKILRESGYASNIYGTNIDTILSGSVLPISDYKDNIDELLLVHYSLGSGNDSWITNLNVPRVMVYHNITPASFFPIDSRLRVLAESGRRQLDLWAQSGIFRGVIADSPFNAAELRGVGYASVVDIALLVDLERIRAHEWNHELAAGFGGARNVLFVGRVCEHKNQLALVAMAKYLARISEVPIRLVLVGETSSGSYEAELRNSVNQAAAEVEVRMLGRLDDRDVYALYRAADLYVSASHHEGFGMPFVEAMAFDLPVLAHAVGGVTETLGSGGLALDDAAPEGLAAAAKLILHEPCLRRAVIEGQRASLRRFERPVVAGAFERYLRQLGFDVEFDQAERTASAPGGYWSMEGPFDSSYSLAVVNRELARALTRTGKVLSLSSRDGPGAFPPNVEFLKANPDIEAMMEPGNGPCPEVCMRNQYPPHVADMRGALRMLANYAWEESGFPIQWVTEFNTCLDLITVTSSYVAKVLRDNGVHVPICVTGNGIDQVLVAGTRPSASFASRAVFRFLHISSGFPRKGIDVLLKAWGAAFTSDDGVELVIKTFPNIHNNIDALLEGFRAEHRDAAPIRLMSADLGVDEVVELYMEADAVVCPSRGEGFGLPAAEAMALGKPVIATGFGGQNDFCTEDTAWLFDYSFAYAKTHLGISDSVWVEPNSESLARVLKEVFGASSLVRARKAKAGRDLILSQYKWEHVAERTCAAIDGLRHASSTEELRLPVIGLVSTWNSRCGIAAYAQSLVEAIEPGRLRVFANRVDEPLRPDAAFVRRCWNESLDENLDELFEEIAAENLGVIVIQYNFGFFRLDALQRFVERLMERNITVLITLHSTTDVIRDDIVARLRDIRETLVKICRILVHSVDDMNRLKAAGIVNNVTLFPHGVPEPFKGDRASLRRSFGFEGKKVVASFGFLLPHKGLRELIEAAALMRRKEPNIHLLMLNSLYPAAVSDEEAQMCLEEIQLREMTGSVSLVTDYLAESEILRKLMAADIVVYPYQNSQESSSAAVRMGLSSLSPVAVTPLPIFADVEAVTHRLPGMTPQDIADGLLELLGRGGHRDPSIRQDDWVEAHRWGHLSARLVGLIRGELRAKTLRCQS